LLELQTFLCPMSAGRKKSGIKKPLPGGSEQLAQTAFFASTSDERLTLLSCYPFTGNTHRIAVIAKPAP
jgi:23S rRNA-/tRNA-specific pseudouridylate synthase